MARMPRLASVCVMERVKWTTPALDAAYTGAAGMGNRAAGAVCGGVCAG